MRCETKNSILIVTKLKDMESLFNTMERLLDLTKTDIVRDYMRKIKWDKRLISIIGARGVGKTTLLLQFIKLNYGQGNRKALYCSMENLYFGSRTLVSLAEEFYAQGGERLILDEVHKYPDWSREVKYIYDTWPELKLVVSGSSILNILNANADLSRRVHPYKMQGLSFREYLRFYRNLDFPAYTLPDLLEKASAICSKVNAKCRPLAAYLNYLKEGYYPFFDGDLEDYYMRITNVVEYIVTQEMPLLCRVDPAYARKIKALVSVVATSQPFEVDITKLGRVTEMARTTVLDYLQKLEKAEILRDRKSVV